MTLYQGSFAMTRYRIVGSKPKDSHGALSKLLKDHKLPPIRIDGPATAEQCGWVRPLLNEMSDELDAGHWDMGDCVVGQDYLMRVRLDRRKVPTSLMQLLMKSKLRDHLEKTGKAMGRKDKLALKTELSHDLLKRSLPVIQYIDVLWCFEPQELLVFTTSKSWCSRVEELFYKTFGEPLDLSLMKADHTTSFLSQHAKSERELTQYVERLSQIQPASFASKAKSKGHVA